MDAVSHLLFGRALAAVTPRPAVDRGITAAIVVGSIVPDVDAVLMPSGWDRYLIWHQRGTHALLGTLVDALVVALLLHLLLRIARRVAPPRPAASYARLALAAWIGCLGHVLLDLVSGGTVRLLWPLSSVPLGVAWTAMADPLLSIPLVLFFGASLIWRRRTTQLAVGMLIVLAAIIGVKEVSRRMAVAAYTRAVSVHRDAPSAIAFEAAWGSFTRWWAFDRTASHVRAWEVDAWHGTTRLLFTRDAPRAPASPGARDVHDARTAASPAAAARPATDLIRASARLETVRHLHELFDLTFADVRPRADASTEVLWADIRFCDARSCALWFGGRFDPSGAPREQLVLVGSLRQTRAP